MTTRAEFVNEARRWVGTRWRHQGRTLGTGVDCVGIVTQTVRAVGPLPPEVIDRLESDVSGYARDATDMLRMTCDKYMRRVPASEAQPGDVILIRFNGKPQHIAILSEHAGESYLIHALGLARRVVEQRFDSVWRARVAIYYTVF